MAGKTVDAEEEGELPLPSSSSGCMPSFFIYFCVILITLNLVLAFSMRRELAIGNEQLTILEQSCNDADAVDGKLPLSRALSGGILSLISHPNSAIAHTLFPMVSRLLSKKLQGHFEDLHMHYSRAKMEWTDCSVSADGTNNRSVPFLPLNLFQVMNDVIISDFTGLMNASAVFFNQFAMGLYSVGVNGQLGDYFQGISKFCEITAEKVKPLTEKPINPDGSVVGNVLTNLPPDLYQTLSDEDTYSKTAFDCMVMAMRLFATDWDTEYVKHDMQGNSRVVDIDAGSNLPVFGKIRDYCNALYLGAQN